ncbi:hypothetical protein B9Z55_018998 [Caenorhabditis nigoni]|nr:hypothetical protein B9Z55_018998 [Caenorhabditis nigoni]
MFSGFNDANAPLSSLTPVFVRGGFILPRQAANTIKTASRLNPVEVLITVKTNAASSGELYYDNGDDIIPNDNIEQHPRVVCVSRCPPPPFETSESTGNSHSTHRSLAEFSLETARLVLR